jgi:hypothetical protein
VSLRIFRIFRLYIVHKCFCADRILPLRAKTTCTAIASTRASACRLSLGCSGAMNGDHQPRGKSSSAFALTPSLGFTRKLALFQQICIKSSLGKDHLQKCRTILAAGFVRIVQPQYLAYRASRGFNVLPHDAANVHPRLSLTNCDTSFSAALPIARRAIGTLTPKCFEIMK